MPKVVGRAAAPPSERTAVYDGSRSITDERLSTSFECGRSALFARRDAHRHIVRPATHLAIRRRAQGASCGILSVQGVVNATSGEVGRYGIAEDDTAVFGYFAEIIRMPSEDPRPATLRAFDPRKLSCGHA